MDVIQLLVTIVVVTILVTIVLAVVTYVAYKLRLAREPSTLDRPADGPRYFIRFDPPQPEIDAADRPPTAGTPAPVSALPEAEGHAS